MSIAYSGCVSVALGISLQRACAVLSSVACSAPQDSSTSHKRHDFPEGKKLLNIKYVFWFSLQRLPEIFLIRRILRRDIVHVHKFSMFFCQILVKFWFFSKDFRKIVYQNSHKSVQWEPRYSVRKDRNDKASVYFIQTNSCTLFKTHSHLHLKL